MAHGKLEFTGQGDGAKSITNYLKGRLNKVGIKPRQIYLGPPWENGCNERFIEILREENVTLNASKTQDQSRLLSILGIGNIIKSDFFMP